MAFSISKFNKGGSKFNINTSGLVYKKLKDLYSDEIDARESGEPVEPGAFTYVIGGLFINKKSKFGDSPAAIVMDVNPDSGEVVPVFIASLPTHTAPTIQEMLDDVEAVQAIKEYKVGFQIREYETKTYHVKAYSPEWVDVNHEE